MSEPERIELWDDPSPEATRAYLAADNAIYPNRTTRDVNRPTISPFLTDDPANSTAVIVCPGGGMVMHAIDHEGWQVARWLQERGRSAYVLEYRLLPSDSDDHMHQRLMEIVSQPLDGGPFGEHAALTRDDVATALAYVRQTHERVVVLGFSAGARVAYEAVTAVDGKPDAAVFIYAPTMPERPLDDAPPAFMMIAADDPIGIQPVIDLFRRWRGAQRPAELHVFERGSHGFGMLRTKSTTDGWIERVDAWLSMHNL